MYYEISTATFQKFFRSNQKIFVIQEVPQKQSELLRRLHKSE